MAQEEIDSTVGDLSSGNSEAGVSAQNKQLSTPVKKTPLRDLQSENNIVAQKGPSNPAVLKEAVISEAAKLSSVKRPSPDSPMSPHQQSSSNSGANGHLVYVRRKLEAETGKNSNHEAITLPACSPTLGCKADGLRPESLISEPQMQTLPACSSTLGCVMSVSPGRPSIPVSLGISNTKTSSVEHKTEAAPSAVALPVELKAKEHNWEDRYVQLQMYLKMLDQSSLEDHLQCMLIDYYFTCSAPFQLLNLAGTLLNWKSVQYNFL